MNNSLQLIRDFIDLVLKYEIGVEEKKLDEQKENNLKKEPIVMVDGKPFPMKEFFEKEKKHTVFKI